MTKRWNRMIISYVCIWIFIYRGVIKAGRSCNIDSNWISLLTSEKSIWKVSLSFFPLLTGKMPKQIEEKKLSVAATKDSFAFYVCVSCQVVFGTVTQSSLYFRFQSTSFRFCVNRIDIIFSVGIKKKKKRNWSIKLYIICRRIRFIGLQLIWLYRWRRSEQQSLVLINRFISCASLTGGR